MVSLGLAGPPSYELAICGSNGQVVMRVSTDGKVEFPGDLADDERAKQIAAAIGLVWTPNADLAAARLRIKALETEAKWFNRHRQSILLDVGSAHSGRGNGASSEMRADDRDFLEDLSAAFDRLDALLSSAQGETKPADTPALLEEIAAELEHQGHHIAASVVREFGVSG